MPPKRSKSQKPLAAQTIKIEPQRATSTQRPQIRQLESRKEKFLQRLKVTEAPMRHIRSLSRVKRVLVRMTIFQRLVRQLADNFSKNQDIRYRWTEKSLHGLQDATESYMTQLMEDSYSCAMHAKRITLMAKDMKLARKIRGIGDPGNKTFY